MEKTYGCYIIVFVILTGITLQQVQLQEISPGIVTPSSSPVTTTATLTPLTTPSIPTTTAPTNTSTTPSPLSGLCSQSPCQNGGSCTETTTSYNCTCINGYLGTNCETKTYSYQISTQFTHFSDESVKYTGSNKDFANPASALFKRACQTLRITILAIFPQALRVHCISMTNSSLAISYVVEFPPNSKNINESTVASRIGARLIQSSYTFERENRRLVSSKDLKPTFAADYDECKRNISGYCHYTALCTNLDGTYACVCSPGTRFNGQMCIKAAPVQDNEMTAIYATVGVLAGLLMLLALLVLCLCCCYGGIGRRRRVYNAVDGAYMEARPVGIRARYR